MNKLNKIAQKLLIKGHNDIFNRLLKLSFEHNRREKSKKSKDNLIAFWTALNNVVDNGIDKDTIQYAINKIKEIEPTVRKYVPELFQKEIIEKPDETKIIKIIKKKQTKKDKNKEQLGLFD